MDSIPLCPKVEMKRLIYESGTKDPASRRQNKTEQTNLAAEFFRFKMKVKVGILKKSSFFSENLYLLLDLSQISKKKGFSTSKGVPV